MPSLEQVHLDGIPWTPSSSYHFTHTSAIVGDNGSWKTHILESIHRLALGETSYKNSPKDWGVYISWVYQLQDLFYEYRLIESSEKKEFFIQWKRLTSPKYFEALPFRTVLFSPFDMNLLYFAPSYRRDMIDGLLKRTFAQFTGVRRQYETVLRQRNALLKQIREGGANRKDLDFWDQKFSEMAETYMLYREKWIAFVESKKEIFELFLPQYSVHFLYITRIDRSKTQQSTLLYLKEQREKDILIWHTTVGPHVDDFTFRVEHEGRNYEASTFLSRGETKILLLLMKYIEIEFIQQITSKNIILLFDDLFAELDEYHMREVLLRFAKYQMIFTTQKLPSVFEENQDLTCITLTLP
jgi:DNA replication and repair protein RecF